MAEPLIPTGGSVLGPAGIQSVSEQPAQQPGAIDTSQAVTDPDGSVWVSRGGEFFTVPAQNLDRAASIPGLRFAKPEEVQHVKFAEEEAAKPGAGIKTAVEHFGTGLIDGITAIPRGLAAGASVAAGYAGATETEAALQDFARDAGGSALARDIAYLSGGVEGESEFVRAYKAREAAFPLTAGVARTAGLLVPAVGLGFAAGAAGAAEGAAGAATEATLAQRLATTLLSPSGVTNTALGGAAAGSVGGFASPFETMEDTPISREAILASGAMGAALGGAAGGLVGAATKYAPSALAKVFGSRADDVARDEVRASMPEAIQQLAESPDEAQRALYRDILDHGRVTAAEMSGIAERIEKAAAAAGPNPELRAAAAREAVEREVQRIASKGNEILPSEWRSSALTPDEMVRNRDVLKLGARNEITERLSSLLDDSKGVMERLRNFELKKPLVAKNLATLTEEQQTNAIGKALAYVRNERSAFERLFEGGEQALGANKTTESLAFSLNEAERAIAEGKTAADAYVAIDKLRRETDKWIAPLTNQSRATSAIDALEGKQLLKFTEGSYENARRFLADADTWGKQGLLQQKVNLAWADDIAAEGRVTKLGAFLSRDVSDRYGQFAQRVDPDKIERYLDGLGKKTLPDVDLHRMLETKAALMREVQAAYSLPEGVVSRAVATTEELGKALKAANQLMTTSGGLETQIMTVLQSKLANMAGGAAGAVVGGALGSVPGALVGHTVGAAIEEYAATRLPQIIQAITSNKLGFGKMPQVYQKALNRQVTESVPAAARFLFRNTADATRAEQLDTYDKRTQIIAKLTSSPDAFAAAATPAVSRFSLVKPTLPASAMLAMNERLARLAQAWPGTQQQSAVAPRGKAQTTVSDEQLRLSAAMWEATTQPLSTLDDFAKGRLDPAKAEFTWLQYPELQQLFQAAALDALQSLPEGKELPHNALAQLDMFLGFGGALDPSQAPESLAVSLSLGAALRAAQAAQQPRPINIQNYQTRVNQISGVTS